MINADDAFMLAINCCTERIEKEWKELEKLIQAEAEKGNFECNYYGYLKPINIKKLEELGYEVEIEGHFGESNAHISWGCEKEAEERIKLWI